MKAPPVAARIPTITQEQSKLFLVVKLLVSFVPGCIGENTLLQSNFLTLTRKSRNVTMSNMPTIQMWKKMILKKNHQRLSHPSRPPFLRRNI